MWPLYKLHGNDLRWNDREQEKKIIEKQHMKQSGNTKGTSSKSSVNLPFRLCSSAHWSTENIYSYLYFIQTSSLRPNSPEHIHSYVQTQHTVFTADGYRLCGVCCRSRRRNYNAYEKPNRRKKPNTNQRRPRK